MGRIIWDATYASKRSRAFASMIAIHKWWFPHETSPEVPKEIPADAQPSHFFPGGDSCGCIWMRLKIGITLDYMGMFTKNHISGCLMSYVGPLDFSETKKHRTAHHVPRPGCFHQLPLRSCASWVWVPPPVAWTTVQHEEDQEVLHHTREQ